MSVRLPFPVDVLDEFPEFDDLVAVLGGADENPPGRRTIERWISQGVPVARADQVAIRLHTHPDVLWPHALPPVALPADDDDYADLVRRTR